MTDENLSLNFLCDKMCVSRMSLYRKIREITQMTPSEYIRSVKISHATHLLRTTNMTIQEIMFCSGFNNKSYFYREFAKIYQCRPRRCAKKSAERAKAPFSRVKIRFGYNSIPCNAPGAYFCRAILNY